MMHDLPSPKEPIPHVYVSKEFTTAIQIITLGPENKAFKGKYKNWH